MNDVDGFTSYLDEVERMFRDGLICEAEYLVKTGQEITFKCAEQGCFVGCPAPISTQEA